MGMFKGVTGDQQEAPGRTAELPLLGSEGWKKRCGG